MTAGDILTQQQVRQSQGPQAIVRCSLDETFHRSEGDDTARELPSHTHKSLSKYRSKINSTMSSMSILDDMAEEEDSLPKSIECRAVVEKRMFRPIAVDKYKFVSQIGLGGCSHVKKARVERTNEMVAIKVIRPSHSSDASQIVQKTENEVACLLRAQGHPNIIRLMDFMTTDRKIFVVTELAAHGDLFDHVVRRGVFSEAETRRLFRQLMSAVAHIHRRGVGHRDIKPENLLLGGSETQPDVKLCDFGFSLQWRREDGLTRGTMGTVRCLPPEMIKRMSWPDPKHDPFAADIWSCATVLFFMLTSHFPFMGFTDDDTLRNTIIGRVTHKPSKPFSPELNDLFRRMFDLDPTRRPSAVQVLDHPYLTGSGTRFA